MRRKLYIVIRYGRLDEFDAVSEIEKVLAKRGNAWFGKYGQPLSRDVERLVLSGKEDVYVVLAGKGDGEGKGYRGYFYNLKRITRDVPETQASFPAYYKKIMSRIGCWLELEPYNGTNLELKDLYTKSSLSPILQSLSGSMRGHFLCRSREGN